MSDDRMADTRPRHGRCPGATEVAQTMSIAIQGAGSPLDGKLSVPLSFI